MVILVDYQILFIQNFFCLLIYSCLPDLLNAIDYRFSLKKDWKSLCTFPTQHCHYLITWSQGSPGHVLGEAGVGWVWCWREPSSTGLTLKGVKRGWGLRRTILGALTCFSLSCPSGPSLLAIQRLRFFVFLKKKYNPMCIFHQLEGVENPLPRQGAHLYMSWRAWEKVRPWSRGGGRPSDPNILSVPVTYKRGRKGMILHEQEVKCVVNTCT